MPRQMDGVAGHGCRQQAACTEGQWQPWQQQAAKPQQPTGEVSGQKHRHRLPAPHRQQTAARLKCSMQGSSAPAQRQHSGWVHSPFEAAAVRHNGPSGAAAWQGTSPPSPFAAQHPAQAGGCSAPPPPGGRPTAGSLTSGGSPPPLPAAIPSAELPVHQAFLAPGWPMQRWVPPQGGGGGPLAAQAPGLHEPRAQESRATPLRSYGSPEPMQQGAPELQTSDPLPPPPKQLQLASNRVEQWQGWTTEEADEQMQQMLMVARELGLLPTCSDCSAGQSQPSWVPPLACDEPSTPPSHCQAGHSTRHELEVSDTAQSSGAERSPPALGYGGESEPPRHQDQDQHRQQHQHAALMPHCTAAAAAAGPCGRAAWPPGVPMPVDMPQLWQPLPPPPQLGFPALLPMVAEGSGAVTPPARLAPAGVPVPPAPQRVRAAAQQQDQQPRMQQQPHPAARQPQVISKQQQQQKPPQQSQQHHQKRKRPQQAGRPPKSCREAEQLGERRPETAALPSSRGLEAANIGAALLAELRRQLSAQQAADAEEWHLEQRRLLQAAQAEQRRQLELAQQAQMLQLERAQLLLKARRVAEQQTATVPVPGGAAVLPVAPAQLLGRQLSHQLHQPAEGQQQQHGIEQLERRRSAEAEAFLRSVSLKQGQL